MTREDHYVSTPHAPNSNPATSELTAQAAEDLLDDAAFMAKAAARMRAAGRGAAQAVGDLAGLRSTCGHYQRQIRAMESTTTAQDGVINGLRNETTIHASKMKALGDGFEAKLATHYKAARAHQDERTRELQTANRQLDELSDLVGKREARIGSLEDEIRELREGREPSALKLGTTVHEGLAGTVFFVPEAKPEAPTPRKQPSREMECNAQGHLLHKEFMVIRPGELARFPCLALGCRWLLGHPDLKKVPLVPKPPGKPKSEAHDTKRESDPDAPATPAALIYEEIDIERVRQDDKWDEQNHPSIPLGMTTLAACHELGIPSENHAKELCDRAARKGKITYAHIVSEEFSESVEADSERDRRGELIQLGACVVAWIEAIDRKEKSKAEGAS